MRQWTSREAEEKSAAMTATIQWELMTYLDTVGGQGATDEEMQVRLGLNGNSQRPVRLGMVRAGWVKDSGRWRLTRAGNPAIVWTLVRPDPA